MQEFKIAIAKLPEPVIKRFHGLEPSVWTVVDNQLIIATTDCTPVTFNLDRIDFNFNAIGIVHVPMRSGVIVTLKGDELREECLEPHLGALRETIEAGDPTAIADELMFYVALQFGKIFHKTRPSAMLNIHLNKLPKDVRDVIDKYKEVQQRLNVLRGVTNLGSMFDINPTSYVTRLLDYAVTCLHPELMADPAKLIGRNRGEIIKDQTVTLIYPQPTFLEFIPDIADVKSDTLIKIRTAVIEYLTDRCYSPDYEFEYCANSETRVPVKPLLDFLKDN